LVRVLEFTVTDGQLPTLATDLFGTVVDEITSVAASELDLGLGFALASQGSAGLHAGRVRSAGSQAGDDAASREHDNIYAGHDGHVYRSAHNGWQLYDGGAWRSIQWDGIEPSTLRQLNRDRALRSNAAG
jgi:hypothetical protein